MAATEPTATAAGWSPAFSDSRKPSSNAIWPKKFTRAKRAGGSVMGPTPACPTKPSRRAPQSSTARATAS